MFYRMIQTTVLSNGKSRYVLVELELGSAIHETWITFSNIFCHKSVLSMGATFKISLYSISKYIKKLYALSTFDVTGP